MTVLIISAVNDETAGNVLHFTELSDETPWFT